MENKFKTGDIVKGRVCGAFIIDSVEVIASEVVYRCHSVLLNSLNQVVDYDNKSMAMPHDALGLKVGSVYY